ncbi:hypothetical protein ABMA28_003167 [Loxostege sticticalis]|uniref:DDE-1 domain-containing protein n=1 Tax=Loxostege sticticalis TaxID=481309 RepID=A0ABD0SWC2_LOXSC
MVSNYKRKTDRGSYYKDKLKEAVQAVKNGNLSGYKASQLYKIPRMTILDHVNNRRTKSNTLGRNTALTLEAEAKLANSLKLMEKHGFGLSRQELLETVGEYAWFTAFKKRHILSLKKPQAVEYARKKAIDPFIVYPYFDLLKKVLEELKLSEKPEAIWNMDETSFSKDPEKTKIVGAKGHAATRVISSPGRENTTVLLCANARGEKAPPMIVYKGKNVWDSWVSPDDYPNTAYAATANGWMESEVFEKYFLKTFLPTIGDQRPVLLIYDGHATHVGLNIIEKAREAGVTILKLPSHTSHVLQPLDISLMKPFKDRWDALLVKWQRLNVGVPLPKKEFARLIGEVWKQIDSQILKNGFRKAGIFPLNVDEIGEENFDSLKLQRWKQHSETISTESSDKIVVQNTPKSLLSLALHCIATLNTGLTLGCSNTLSKTNPKGLVESQLESEEPKNIHQVQKHLSSTLNKDSAKVAEKGKIQITENKLVTFEDLLLMKIKPGNNETVKRRKMAPGAEVITHEDVLKRKMEEKLKNIKKETQTKKGQGVGKKSRDSEKDNVERSVKKPKVKKRAKIISPDSTSVSDCVSIYSDSDVLDCDEDIFIDTNMTSPMQIENTNDEEAEMWEVDPLNYGPSTSKKCLKGREGFAATKKVKDILKGKLKKNINKDNIFIDTNTMTPTTTENNKNLNEICNKSERENKRNIEEKLKNIKTKKGKGIGKKSRNSEKENVERSVNKPKVKKRAKIISPDSTSVSDCVSIYSDSDVLDCDEDIFIDTNMTSPMQIENTNDEEAEMWEVDPLNYGPSTSKKCLKRREGLAATKKGKERYCKGKIKEEY